MPIRIAFCITELDPGGAEKALVNLVKRLDRTRFEPAVFCLGPRTPLVEEIEKAGIPVTCFGVKRSWQFWVVFRLMRSLKRFRPEILQTWLFHANLAGRFAGRFSGVPMIVSGIRVAEKRSRLRLWLDRLTQSWSLAHVCVSRAVADFSIEHSRLKPDSVHVIPNGVEVEKFANAPPANLQQFGIPANSKAILFVGRLDEQKDPLWLWEAFEILRSQAADVHVIYVGQGDLESQLKQRIAGSPSHAHGHVLGWRPDVPELLKAADLLVLPSRWEGMPNVVLEAAAAGTPVVSTNVEGVSEILTDGVTGRIIKTRDPEELAGAMASLLEDDDLRITMAESLQRHARKHFTNEIVARRYAQFYEGLKSKRRSGDS